MRIETQAGAAQITRTVISPETAREMLEGNTHNRFVSNKVLKKLTAAISQGEWRYNAQPIQVTTEGTLLDGQHRLMACVAAGISIECLVVWDALADSQETMDMGRARSIADVLRLRGYANQNLVAAFGKRVALAKRYGLRAGATHRTGVEVSNGSIIEAVEEVADLHRYTIGARQLCYGFSFTASQIGFLMWWFDSIDREDSQHFWETLRTGQGLYEGDAIYALRTLGTNREVRGLGTKYHQNLTAALIIKAWNKFRTGETTQRLTFRVGGSKPEAFPEPV